MDRKIRFRFWDGESMWSPTTFILNANMIPCTPTGKDGGLEMVEYTGEGDYERNLMQYTGLTDKEGQEIYEGDILETSHITGRTIHWEVKWHYYGWFAYADWSGASSQPLGHIQRSAAVAGNIHENPELLEQ